MKIKDVKYSYLDKRYGLGPYIDFCGELEVERADYDSIVSSLEKVRPGCEDITIMSFTKA